MGGWVHDICGSYVLDFVVLIFYGCENVARDAKARVPRQYENGLCV